MAAVDASREFVYQRFSEFYKDPANAIPSPPLPEQREFGYLMFKERFMVRHRHFNSIEDFRKLLAQTTPSDVYHSCAYYENPDFDMDKKGWTGSDVVFDIDADRLSVRDPRSGRAVDEDARADHDPARLVDHRGERLVQCLAERFAQHLAQHGRRGLRRHHGGTGPPEQPQPGK
jgi:DNA primase small subunit